jgi:molecular chaperone DnaK
MRVTPTSGLSQEEIERIIKEAEHMAESDHVQRDKIDLQNKLASLVKNTQRTFLEFGGLLEAEQQESGQRILTDGEAAAKADELGEIRMALDALERLGRQLTHAMMKGAGATHKAD